jgi:hypothetical protein
MPGQSDQEAEVRATADAVLRAIVEMGGSYPDAVQFLQQATASRGLASRLAFDALPDEFDGRHSIHEEASSRDRDIGPEADDPRTPSAADPRPDEAP